MARPTFQEGVTTKAVWLGIKGELQHEYDQWGSHRLTLNGKLGDWANYGEPCYLKLDDRLFCATTDYFMPDLPEIFEVTSIVGRTLSEGYS